MSCPYFYPVAPAIKTGFLPGRAPLGDVYEGTCHAEPGNPAVPAIETAREQCNYGYAAGQCVRFPGDADADAVRFSISASNELIWIFEKAYFPVRHGMLGEAGPVVKRQAEVFRENYEQRSDRTAGSRINI